MTFANNIDESRKRLSRDISWQKTRHFWK